MLITLGVVGRFVFIEYISIPNFEIITTISLIAGIYLGGMFIAILTIFVVPVLYSMWQESKVKKMSVKNEEVQDEN